ncbi:acetyl CoA synthetase subunit alpha [Salinibacter sp. 10B]|uniref:bifunctional acetate--CoA ligase family protein/GNAT family N-acetyltransferase n=1 Tax=Salinibacter sp. 10B TaxID=1923971 RepID=UPI000CF4A84E|nr:bifunctional acetate--CoA ligase family protein/GNAT family N-acetyltransferase [Salinibacter sp. 10B]PQJ33598.1 acetyl CoA synthetase subunit alpha [Salinibacter sp. 10B]
MADPETSPNSTPTSDPSYDLISSGRQPLDAIFTPDNVAVIGASESPGSVGRTLLWNLVSNPFGGTIFPVNPKRNSVLGIEAYSSIQDVEADVDLAVIATPAPTVPTIVEECGEAGVQGLVIVSAGFREVGEEGAELEREIKEIAREYNIRIVGPNCLGVMRPPDGLNATFAGSMAQEGNVAFVSQSGALLTSILDWSFRENVGFSSFVSIGSMLDVDWGDMITYLGDDPKTDSIVLYMESIGNARSFLSAARDVAQSKPIIVIKAGRTQAAAEAAASHTGTLTGSDAVLNAAFRRSGVLRVDDINDLFYMAEVLGKQPRPEGPNLTILTNAGGPGVLATDALIDGGGELTPLSEEALEDFDEILPPAWSHSNPVDILGDADPERYAKSLEVAANDENSDGLLVVLTPQAMTEPTKTAEHLRPYARDNRKPVLASWMGGDSVAPGENILNEAGLPTFAYPDTAARVFNNMWRYSYNLKALYETPSLPEDEEGIPDRDAAAAIVEETHQSGRVLMTEYGSKQLLSAYGIPTVETKIAETPHEAVAAAQEIGYPVAVKLHSTSITHKSDVGGVHLELTSDEDVKTAFERIDDNIVGEGFDGVTVQPMIDRSDGYELIIGSSMDQQFGPVLLFGSGGQLVEVYKDRALGLPPLNTTLARRMMEQTKIYEALKGVRGRDPVDMDALETLLVRFSQLVVEQPRVKEIDVNPLLARPGEDGLLALDARVVLHPYTTDEEELPTPAIRPYPRQYIGTQVMRNGEEVTIRPIRPEDEPKLVTFHERLSERSVYLRYASLMKLEQRVAHDRLARICFIDYDREMALVAERTDADGEEQIIGVGRLTQQPGRNEAEFGMLVIDEFQEEGIGTELLRRLVQVGEDEGLDRITADILEQNRAMQRVCEKLDFELVHSSDPDEDMVKAVRTLRD